LMIKGFPYQLIVLNMCNGIVLPQIVDLREYLILQRNYLLL